MFVALPRSAWFCHRTLFAPAREAPVFHESGRSDHAPMALAGSCRAHLDPEAGPVSQEFAACLGVALYTDVFVLAADLENTFQARPMARLLHYKNLLRETARLPREDLTDGAPAQAARRAGDGRGVRTMTTIVDGHLMCRILSVWALAREYFQCSGGAAQRIAAECFEGSISRGSVEAQVGEPHRSGEPGVARGHARSAREAEKRFRAGAKRIAAIWRAPDASSAAQTTGVLQCCMLSRRAAALRRASTGHGWRRCPKWGGGVGQRAASRQEGEGATPVGPQEHRLEGSGPATAQSIKKTVSAQADAAQRRDLIANSVEMDAYSRILAAAAKAGVAPTLLLLLLLLDLEAAFPSVSQRFLVASLRAEGFPPGLMQVVEALYADNELLWQGRPVRTICVATPWVARCAAPCLRRRWTPSSAALGSTPADLRAGMARACADDLDVVLRSARLAGDFSSPRDRTRRGAGADGMLRAHLQEGAPEWHEFELVPTGKCLGIPLGRATEDKVWIAPLAKWHARADTVARMQMPGVAATVHYRQRVLLVVLHVSGMYRAPLELARLERDTLGRMLRLPGGAMSIRGHWDLRD